MQGSFECAAGMVCATKNLESLFNVAGGDECSENNFVCWLAKTICMHIVCCQYFIVAARVTQRDSLMTLLKIVRHFH